MTDPETPAHDSYDASILEVLAGLDPPKPRPRAFTTLDDAGYIAALNDAYAQGRIIAARWRCCSRSSSARIWPRLTGRPHDPALVSVGFASGRVAKRPETKLPLDFH
jgi:hypothetical protein